MQENWQQESREVYVHFRFDNTLPKTAARWILEVLRNSGTQTLGIIELHKCLESELAQNTFYQFQSDSIKEGLRYCLNAINPDMHTSVKHSKCGSKNVPNDSIVLSIKNRVYFINNTDYVCRAIIKILYELRCKLFHGEIDPHDDYLDIYEHACYIQRTLNQSICGEDNRMKVFNLVSGNNKVGAIDEYDQKLIINFVKE